MQKSDFYVKIDDRGSYFFSLDKDLERLQRFNSLLNLCLYIETINNKIIRFFP